MANKNKANALVSNLGIGKQKVQIESTPEASETAKESRPSVEAGCKAGDTRTTIILNKELIKKVKFIALAEGKTIKDKATEAFTTMVEKWEKENGPIPQY
ncbi:hypothetical protein [Prevotella sp.]|uniref:hypothetical protein n=1 Tax=Prevotella sp. TaxID=59823 RepID=UPI00402622B3